MRLILLLGLCILLVGCTIETPAAVVEEKVCAVCPTCTATTCPEVKVCEVCEVCEVCGTVEDELKIIRVEKDYDWGLHYQNEANKTLSKLDRYVELKEFDNCSRIIPEGINDIETANAFFALAKKRFDLINDSIVAVAFSNASAAYIEYNKDYVQYLLVYETFCDKYDDGEDDIDNDYMDERGEKWLDRADVHWIDYQYNLRILDELR